MAGEELLSRFGPNRYSCVGGSEELLYCPLIGKDAMLRLLLLFLLLLSYYFFKGAFMVWSDMEQCSGNHHYTSRTGAPATCITQKRCDKN